MLLIYGRQKLRIKRYTDNQQSCMGCGCFDLDVQVYRDYYHFFFIPFFPTGFNTVKMRCKACGEPMRVDSLQKQYEERTKTPFYLFSGIILSAFFILLLVMVNRNTEKEKVDFVWNPLVGDVYGIKNTVNNSTTYAFLRLSEIKGDTIRLYHNNLEYSGFVDKFHESDYFVEDEYYVLTKKELRVMLEKEIIHSVDRNYGDYEGFRRLK